MKKSTFECPVCKVRTRVTTTKKYSVCGTSMPLRYHTCPDCGKTYTIMWVNDEPKCLWVAQKRETVANKLKEVVL